MSLCATAHLLHTRTANIFGASISETAIDATEPCPQAELAARPEGGHAVKAVGWGVGPEKDASGQEVRRESRWTLLGSKLLWGLMIVGPLGKCE